MAAGWGGVTRFRAGAMPDGTPLHSYRLHVEGLTATVSEFGATLTGLRCPDRHGRDDDVLVGLPDMAELIGASADPGWCYPGSTVGRFANRIRDAGFSIDGTHHELAANEGRHQRHGGPIGFDRRRWTATPIDGEIGVRLELESPDGDQGFPGALALTLDVVALPPARLALRYTARASAPTHVNLTSHGYFNLDGARARTTIDDHRLSIAADRYLPIDGDALPTGELAGVAHGPFDLRKPRRIGDVLADPHPQLVLGDGFNHCFVLAADGGGLRRAACLSSPASGREMEVWTSEPGVQLYTGNALAAAAGGRFRRREGLCLEPQHFPDSPNQPHFPPTLLRPGDLFQSSTELRFSPVR